MNVFLILVLTQLIVESLPISSSFHVYAVQQFFMPSLQYQPILSSVVDYSLHGCAVISILFFFRASWVCYVRRLWRIARGLERHVQQFFLALTFFAIGQLLVAVFVTLWYFIVLQKIILLCGCDSIYFRIAGLGVTMFSLVSLRWCRWQQYSPVRWYHYVALAVAQCCALLPGISRFALCYTTLRWLRCSPWRSFEMSFVVAMPIMFAACFFKGLPAVLYDGAFVNAGRVAMNITIIVGMIGSLLALHGVSYLIRKERMWWFGCYMIMPILFCCWLLVRR